MDRTPDGETNTPCLRSSLLARVCPYAGKSIAKAVTATSIASSTRFFRLGLRLLTSNRASTPPASLGGLIPIKGITRKSHHLAGLGNIAKLGGEIEKPGLVFDDVLIETFHWESPWAWCPVDGAFTLPSKRSFPFRSRAHCQSKSKLTHI